MYNTFQSSVPTLKLRSKHCQLPINRGTYSDGIWVIYASEYAFSSLSKSCLFGIFSSN